MGINNSSKMLDLTHLNKEQKEAVTHKDGPLLIVAGAGTGKTTVVTNRVAWLIDQNLCQPDEILCLTFTDKAAGEMEERIDKILPYGYIDLWVMTFHAFAERVLKQHGMHIGIAPDFRLLDQTTQWMLIHQHFDQFELDYYKPLGNPTKFISAMLTHFSRAKDEGVMPDSYLEYIKNLEEDSDKKAFSLFKEKISSSKKRKEEELSVEELWEQDLAQQKELANAYYTYQKILHENNALDFGDLIVYVKELFTKRPQILEQYRQKFKYILVDEFQDTNWAQYEIVKVLTQPTNNLTVVGDDDQSVYKFRGASLSNILGFKSDFAKSKQVVLTTNYRSTQNILDLAYEFIQNNNPHRLEYKLNQDSGIKDQAEKKNLDLSGFSSINKQLKSALKGKGVIEHLHFYSLIDESAGVVQSIIKLQQEDPDLNWGDFAILVRANASAEPFIQQLTLAEVPYQFMASAGLFSKPAVMDVLSYLKILDDYAESTALYRILILPTIDLSNEDLMKLLFSARKQALSLRETLKIAVDLGLSPDGIHKCQKVLDLIETHARLARQHRVSEVAMAFIDDYELKQHFETLDPLQQRDTYQLLNQFWKMMQQFEQESDDKSVKTFLQYLELAKKAGDGGALPQNSEHGPDTVKVMTIHGSKGLEFKHVYVVNMVDRRFPTTERKDPLPLPEALVNEITPGENHHLEEERRLCYVAVTRAKEGLYFTSAEDYGGVRRKKPSRFLIEMNFPQKEPVALQSKIAFGETAIQNFEVKKAQEFNYADYLPKTYSYSQLKVFQTCPWQYRYAHILKIPVQGRHTFSFGKSMHHSLETFFNQSREKGEMLSKEELIQLYDESWIDDWYLSKKQKEEYYQKGKESLDTFYDIHQSSWPDIEETEQGFTLKIGPYTLRGSIDRLDRKGEKLSIVDYKTGKVPKTDASIDKDQLIIYQIAVEDILGKEVEDLTYYFLNENVAKTFTVKPEQKEKLKDKVLKVLNELTESDFTPTPSKVVCDNCDYKNICTYRML